MTTVPNTGFHCETLDETSPNCSESVSENNSSATGCNFDCSICLEVAQDPVVTMCGHLFCWPCLHQWITIHSELEECPVCKACVRDKIIPLYGRGKTGFGKPQVKMSEVFDIPRRPSAHLNHSLAPQAPRNSGTHYHGFIARENSAPTGDFSTSSVAAFGLFPALFGVHMINSPNHYGGLSSGTSFSSMPFRMLSFSSMTSQQHRLNSQQEFVVYWCLIMLAGFATLCFLFF